MTDRSVEIIAALAQPASYGPGEALTREGDPGDTFIVLTERSADVSQDGHRIRSLEAGDFLGEISLIDGGS